ncbi:hypothetical protein P154DRAFT_532750 [Amniculicola lignicola CBS 123094]|uniref:Uncharacterized protein n=1 Tax=Amniculicola lignicola CBS 123094 TaxID=1392246 RepID=A0A6A5WPS1_9PLEO|nr:hypothetical protein P154DRAFT_532750 [Amniculicola lignicola CBS 123094]
MNSDDCLVSPEIEHGELVAIDPPFEPGSSIRMFSSRRRHAVQTLGKNDAARDRDQIVKWNEDRRVMEYRLMGIAAREKAGNWRRTEIGDEETRRRGAESRLREPRR